VRIDQMRSGETALGRTVVLVAPTPAEYRLLGTNERLLGALRGATGGRALETGLEAWTRDLASTTASRDLWPWLLLAALLLWPLDVGIRRVSVGRRDLALARTWTAERWRQWRGPAARTAPVGGMLAAKERAAGRRTRAALFQSDGDRFATPAETRAAAPGADPASSGSPAPASGPSTLASPDPARTDPATSATTPATTGSGTPTPNTPSQPPEAVPADTMARLKEARERARRR
jgi:hypothetical protein